MLALADDISTRVTKQERKVDKRNARFALGRFGVTVYVATARGCTDGNDNSPSAKAPIEPHQFVHGPLGHQ